MNQPIPPYLIALAVGKLEFAETGHRTGVFAEPPLLARATREFADTELMIKSAEELYGAYRWGRFDLLVLPPSFPFGGMEIPKVTFVSPTLITGDKSLVSLVVHELAHSWSGNLVTNATWSDFWLNEGFTTYIEHRIFRQLYGPRRAEMEQVLQRRRLNEEMALLPPSDQVLHIDLDGRDPDDGASLVPYEKGALLLHTLEASVGRERFDRFLREYFDEFAFKSVTTNQVVDYIARKLLDAQPEQIRALEEWVSEPGLPASAPQAYSEALEAIETIAAQWLKGWIRLEDVIITGWSPQELLHFLDSLPPDIGIEKLGEIDRKAHLTSSTNSEVLQRWLLMAIRNQYEPAYGALEHFLRSVGRRKYLKPLYEELVKTAEHRRRAETIYAEVRSRYHPITQATIDGIVKRAAEAQLAEMR